MNVQEFYTKKYGDAGIDTLSTVGGDPDAIFRRMDPDQNRLIGKFYSRDPERLADICHHQICDEILKLRFAAFSRDDMVTFLRVLSRSMSSVCYMADAHATANMVAHTWTASHSEDDAISAYDYQ